MFPRLILFSLTLLIAGCVPGRKAQRYLTPVTVNISPEPDAEAEMAERYQPSRTRHFDLLHTRLELQPDASTRSIAGVATLTLKPYFYAQQQLTLDAKEFDIHAIDLLEAGNESALSYHYEAPKKLHISLPRSYKSSDTLHIRIRYTAYPEQGERGGSWAITSDQGFYFINPDGSIPDMPQQMWTQGETESNSRWFPSFDSPNERCTGEIIVRVDARFTTISNGNMVNSILHEDGTRSDHWKMDLPHAPYLFALVAGDFAKIEDRWRDVPVNYYVEPKWAAHARAVFGNTPAMIGHFSQLLGVPYPWPQYNQVVVRDFVSGAMENTGCVVMHEGLQKHRNEVALSPEDDIISHELFHHWFGDLVTCESWSHIPLNESFATYGEYLWREHKNGKADAEAHLYEKLQAYLDEALEKRKPLIRYHYADREEMFDRHSYEKGALVLHYLRSITGDEAFFQSLNLYLKRHAFQTVEVHQLRLAFEETIGLDLHAFFEEFFLSPGHPRLATYYALREDPPYVGHPQQHHVSLTVKQLRDHSNQPLYHLPLHVALYFSDGSRQIFPISIETADTTFHFDHFDLKPVAVQLDPYGVLPGVIDQTINELESAVIQLRQGLSFRGRMDALTLLTDYIDQDDAIDAILPLLRDPSPQLRAAAIEALRAVNGPRRKDILRHFMHSLSRDSDAGVRSAALNVFATELYLDFMKSRKLVAPLSDSVVSLLARDSSFSNRADALLVLSLADAGRASQYALEIQHEGQEPLLSAVIYALLAGGQPEALPKLREIARSGEGYVDTDHVETYMKGLGPDARAEALRFVMDFAEYSRVSYQRLALFELLENHLSEQAVRGFMLRMKNANQDEDLKAFFERLQLD